MKLPPLQPTPQDNSVRPPLRVLGALLLAAIAALFVREALPLFSHESAISSACKPGRARPVCELGAWLVSLLPAHTQGPVLAVATIGVAGILLLLAGLLLKPLMEEASATSESKSPPV
jgi:hypothetical protein